ncbi:hypothetical protein [Candidatus Protochlamydia phocaeensis]|uniref:hypothetical protein n=1 Tax=Candidatus Protochlamydia phocaeensis TaxID=1414722 RepID=UPI0008383E5C|nr:hypothetical protein [Candidatus Protochlamydia phocaeensis]
MQASLSGSRLEFSQLNASTHQTRKAPGNEDEDERKIFVIANTCIGVGALTIGSCALVKSSRFYKIIQRGDACLLGLILFHTGLSFYAFNPNKAASAWFACTNYFRKSDPSTQKIKHYLRVLCLLNLLKNKFPDKKDIPRSASPQNGRLFVINPEPRQTQRPQQENEDKEASLLPIVYLAKMALRSLFSS